MNLWQLIIREIAHRKLNFALALLSMVSAVACLVALLTILCGHDVRTGELLAQREQEVKARGQALKDDMRKITKGLGFNILILPEGQNLADVYADQYAAKTMPEEYVTRLAAQKDLVTVNHLLPSLEQKLVWPERKRTIILTGIRGEVPFVHRNPKKPLLDPVGEGEMVLGYELHTQLDLQPGSQVKFMDREFTIAKCYPQRGSSDDITAWMKLATAQELLDKQGRINAIWALECNCASIDRLAEIREDIAGILPETQVIEIASQATARAKARVTAEKEAKQALSDEQDNRSRLRSQIESVAEIMVPLVVLASSVWVGLLTLGNVRDRRSEIGILRAVGLRSSQILSVFLAKAVLAGVSGALLGILLGLAIGVIWYRADPSISGETGQVGDLLMPWLLTAFAAILAGTPLVAALASWLPALLAAQQDPAEVLSEE